MSDAWNGSPASGSGNRHDPQPVMVWAQAPDCEPPWVVVLEDDEGILRLITIVLERHGYRVTGATSVTEMRTLLLNSVDEPSLCLVDLNLPRSSGLVIAEEIRRTRPRVKVLFTSGIPKHSILVEGREILSAEYLPKPFTIDGLLDKVAAVLRA
ncbi:response regulator [Paludibaculum fermentans]|uniref:response regulator n=1 Tax=Paludibaculum fermentans TaxID=1473598 RepID=UPI003EBAD83D